MQKIAFVFADQGAQKVGMGSDLRDLAETEESLSIARAILSADFFDLLWHGEQEVLNQTAFAQPALFWHGFTLAQLLLARGITPQASCGLSLGEYTALAVAEVLDFAEGLKLVYMRGQLMGEAVKGTNTGMLALMTDNEKLLRQAMDFLNSAVYKAELNLYVSNLNCPGQIVVAGDKEQLVSLRTVLARAGIKRAIPLAVEGAFHTPLLKETATKFKVFLQSTAFKEGLWPVYSNYDAKTHEGEAWTDTLAQQMLATVQLEACLLALIAEGVEIFIEIGPGKVISGCLKKIDSTLKCYQVSDYASVHELANTLLER